MEEWLIGVLGMTATALSTVSLLPQVVRTWRTRSANDLSAVWLVVALIAMLVWISYGSLIHAPAVIVVNILSLFQCSFLLFMKLQSGRAQVAKSS